MGDKTDAALLAEQNASLKRIADALEKMVEQQAAACCALQAIADGRGASPSPIPAIVARGPGRKT